MNISCSVVMGAQYRSYDEIAVSFPLIFLGESTATYLKVYAQTAAYNLSIIFKNIFLKSRCGKTNDFLP